MSKECCDVRPTSVALSTHQFLVKELVELPSTGTVALEMLCIVDQCCYPNWNSVDNGAVV